MQAPASSRRFWSLVKSTAPLLTLVVVGTYGLSRVQRGKLEREHVRKSNDPDWTPQKDAAREFDLEKEWEVRGIAAFVLVQQ